MICFLVFELGTKIKIKYMKSMVKASSRNMGYCLLVWLITQNNIKATYLHVPLLLLLSKANEELGHLHKKYD